MSLRVRSYLEESTFNLDIDVDDLYRKSGLDRLNGVLSREDPVEIRQAFSPVIDGKIWLRVGSESLRSRIAKRAHKENPISIFLGVDRGGSFYRPSDREVQATVNLSALGLVKDALRSMPDDPSSYLKSIVGSQYERFCKEFDASNVKGTISHELSHWVSDSLHGRNISNVLSGGIRRITAAAEKGDVLGVEDSIRGKFPSMTQHPLELNAQVHAIKTIKREIGQRKFDNLTWADLFRLKPSLIGNLRISPSKFLSSGQYSEMIRRFVKRLDREGLLGKRMRNFPSRFEFAQIAAQV